MDQKAVLVEQEDIESLDQSCGFKRQDCVNRNPSPNATSPDGYNRHLLVCVGAATSSLWPADFPKQPCPGEQSSETSSLLFGVFKKNKINGVKLSGCALDSLHPDRGLDIVSFPDGVRFVGINASNVEAFLSVISAASKEEEEQRKQEAVAANVLSVVPLDRPGEQSLWIAVCAHAAVDKRCGFCGPRLIEHLRSQWADPAACDGLSIRVFGTTHVGGHKYAGNVIMFPRGEWYGYVTTADVPRLIQSYREGVIVPELWRGRLGMSKAEQQELIAALKNDQQQR